MAIHMSDPSSYLKSCSTSFPTALLSGVHGLPKASHLCTDSAMGIGHVVLGRHSIIIRAATTTRRRKGFYPGEQKGFVEEMRFVAMKLHTKEQAKEGEKDAEDSQPPIGQWQPSMKGYLKFLVDSKLVFGTMESIVQKAAHPSYLEFANTGLERSAKIAKDLKWFKSKGYDIPEHGEPGLSYAQHLKKIAEEDPPAFICHFYNIYFAHTAGGRMIGRKVAEMILDGRELEFYKWDGDLTELMADMKAKLNKVAKGWSREEKNNCLKETGKSFKYSGKILQLIVA